MNGKFVKHVSCLKCGSSDANALYADGHTHCFSCNTSVFPDQQEWSKSIEKPIFRDITDRRISKQTAERYGVSVTVEDGVITTHKYPYFSKEGLPVASKYRECIGKKFRWEGEAKQATLFGQQLFPPKSAKIITIVEGEIDAMSVYEMNGRAWPVVSVHSAGSAPKNVADNFEYLNSFETIVVCFDRDEPKMQNDGSVRYPGQEAAIAVAGMFALGKVKILTLEHHKDANDYLVNGMEKQFISEWWKAPTFMPNGLKIGKDMWEEVSAPKNYESVPYPWDRLNLDTYGIRLSEFVVITAETGIGKTSILKEIEYSLLNNEELKEKGYGIGLLHLEEPNADTALGLMSIAADKPLHLPNVREQVTTDELRGYFDATVNNDRVVIWDHFGSNSIHEVLNKVRQMHNLGCKYIVLDHLSIVVSDQQGDERKQLDEISTKLKTLCMELNIAILAVIHQNRQGQIRGTAGVEQLANMVLKLHRDKEDADPWRRNVTKVVIQKNRFCGRTGPGCYLYYEPMTGRLYELTDEEIARYEAGGSQSNKGEEPW